MIENDLCLGKGNCLKKIFGRFKHRTNLKILKPQGTVWGSQAWLSCLGSTPAYIIVLSPCKCFLGFGVPLGHQKLPKIIQNPGPARGVMHTIF